ncbi:MAG TPA: MFS transporter [Actinomycetota bacterium]|nr:MFS transporter [Actinomycetota bacterium]
MATDGRPAGAGSLRLLGANRPFRLLWSARAVSFLGDSLGLVALMLHVAGTTGQALAVAALLLAGDFAPALLGPLTGTVADRLDRRRVMVGCELVQGALVVAIALWLPSLPLPLLLVLVGLRAVAGQVFQPASRAAVPAVVGERDLERANAAVGVATNGGEALGPLVAAVALPVLGVRGVLLVDAASFLVSAALLGRLPALTGPTRGPRSSFLADAAGGLRYLRGQAVVRVVALGYFAVVACTGIDDVALVFLATSTFGTGAAAVGLLLAAVGIGLLAGYALLARTAGRRAAPRTPPIVRGTTPAAAPRTPPATGLLLAGFAVSSAGNLLTGLAWAVAAAFAVQAVRGLGIAAMDVAATTLVQRTVPAELQGRVFGSLYGGIGVAAALSYLLGGLLLDRTSPRVAFVAAGAAGLLATGATALALRRAVHRSYRDRR